MYTCLFLSGEHTISVTKLGISHNIKYSLLFVVVLLLFVFVFLFCVCVSE